MALRDAKIVLISGPTEVMDEKTGKPKELDYSSPHHWAAFQLIGDW